MQYKEHIIIKVIIAERQQEMKKGQFQGMNGYRSSVCLEMVAAVVKPIAAIQTGITPLYKIC